MTITENKTITLTDLAVAVNRLIDEQPNTRNPQDEDTSGCLYYLDDGTEIQRCLIGQALYDLTGKNVPAVFEETGIDTLFQNDEFVHYFGLEVGENFDLRDDLADAQGVADGHARWGVIDKVNV